MRSYLTDFFREFEYEAADAAHLLATYDAIVASAEAAQLLTDALSTYDASIAIDYKEEIIARSKQIAQFTLLAQNS